MKNRSSLELEVEKIIFMFFFLSKKEPKSQEKVIGQRAMPDAAPLPFPAHAPFLVLFIAKIFLVDIY